jgi:hypothetical protein
MIEMRDASRAQTSASVIPGSGRLRRWRAVARQLRLQIDTRLVFSGCLYLQSIIMYIMYNFISCSFIFCCLLLRKWRDTALASKMDVEIFLKPPIKERGWIFSIVAQDKLVCSLELFGHNYWPTFSQVSFSRSFLRVFSTRESIIWSYNLY